MQREITRELVRRLLPGRMAESNKGSYGSVLAAAGSMAYRGAAALCTEGALRGGAGLLSSWCFPARRNAAPAAAARRPTGASTRRTPTRCAAGSRIGTPFCWPGPG